MSDTEVIKSLVDEYQLEINGVKFWTPYFINKAQVHDEEKGKNLPAPHLGKGTPEEILAATQGALHRTGFDPKTPDEFRQFMRDQLIGVECSGFAYYMYSQLLRSQGRNLDDNLFWTREELLNAYDRGIPWHRPELSRPTVEAYPDHLALSRVSQDWGWKLPRLLVRADRFMQADTSKSLNTVAELRPGDMITMRESTGSNIGHLVVVAKADESQIVYAHSSRLDNTVGGVHYGKINILDPTEPIASQGWEESVFFSTHHQYVPRRLNALDRG